MFKFCKLRGYKSLELYHQKCKDFGAQYLDSESDSFVMKCGFFCNLDDDLYRLPPIIAEALRQFLNHMSSLALIYKNNLSFRGVGISNKFGGGWQKNFHEPHAATINGRTY